ncbi:MAG TPA: thiolase domain-containing protein [Methanoregulaceae archaeon]|nr:MAG: thiolase domain-containing protein [Methanolinea sp.]HON81954.1 thiolase domain-containing protein [Methanoregulaceae archaeon]HPD10710.1 thiolase domain-containing protein [Methanoregulaceae archaeon]HRT15839.1 thiolase domain-containing protein [Methanoregulaceae archaeon]HRU31596.1 thiolase domain-containing protein [Methanoregulaceae archaeon]
MRDVAVIGAGCTPFGEKWNSSFRNLFVEAGILALEDAGVAGEQIGGLYVGNMSAGRFIEQEHIGALIADYAGLASHHIPATRVEAACASGGLSFRQAVIAVASGMEEIVVAAGVEKMTDVASGASVDALAGAADREWEGFVGATFPGLYAMIATDYMNRYPLTREQLAQVAVKNHFNGARNPIAQFRQEITIDTVIRSSLVADPLRLFDCSPITDGAAAVVLAPLDRAREFTDTPVRVLASAQASDTITLHDRRDISTLDATVAAGRRAFAAARLSTADIDLVEVHDCFTIAEICAIEDLGFCRKGEAGRLTEEGATALNGDIPVNTSGGLKACGHPVGATGIKQVFEVVQQLRGEAGKRQIEGAAIGMTHNVGGTGATVAVHILGV